jgi:hypothetical protein
MWSDEVEKAFAQTEGGPWVHIRNKILKDKTIDKLSEIELNNFLSFIFALKTRKKENVDEFRKGLAYVNTDFDNKCFKYGEFSKEEVGKIHKYDNFEFDCIFLSLFSALPPDKTPWLIEKYEDDYIYEYFSSAFSSVNPNELSLPLRPFKRFSFGVKTIQEQDTKYGQFLTSDSPLLVESTRYGNYLFNIFLMIALSPTLLVFGAKGVETFMALHNVPINIFIKEFNQEIYNNSKYIVSNKKFLLEQFL